MKFVFALFVLVALTAAECEKLLNCDSCKDDSHCESCKEGYTLDGYGVCRFDCVAKFGYNCPSCTEEKCLCPAGYDWDNATMDCIDVVTCTSEDGPDCDKCGKDFDVVDVNGKCSTCKSAFGEGCLKCSQTKCTEVADGYKICGAVVVQGDCPTTCAALFPGCTQCDSDSAPTKCKTCSEGTVLSGGFCKFKMPTCQNKAEKPLYVNGEFVCQNCTVFDDNCAPGACTYQCTACTSGYGITTDGKCVGCAEAFTGCGLCSGVQCTKCRSSQWILTPNGCFNQNPYEPESEPEKSKAGMIVGIVIACVALIVIIIIALYCIITSAQKKGQVDTSTYEDDFEFKSVSVL